MSLNKIANIIVLSFIFVGIVWVVPPIVLAAAAALVLMALIYWTCWTWDPDNE